MTDDARAVLALLVARWRRPYGRSRARGIAQALGWYRDSGELSNTPSGTHRAGANERRVVLALRDLKAAGLVDDRTSKHGTGWRVTAAGREYDA